MTFSELEMLDIRENCSEIFPVSSEFFKEISDAEEGLVIFCGVLTVVIILWYAELVYFILRYYETNATVKHKSVQILGIYPVIGVTSLMAVCMPRASLICDLVGSVYLAWSLFNFTTLIVDYLGGEEVLLLQFKGEKIKLQSPPLACCCPCLPMIEVSRKNLMIMRLLVFQTALLQPLNGFLSVVLWTDNKYEKGQISTDNGYPYLATPNGISTLVAMYGLIMVFRFSRKALEPLHIRPKFVVLQLVLIFHNLQDFIFVILAKNDIPSCRGTLSSKIRGEALQHMIKVGEMLILAIVARCFYRRHHFAMDWQYEKYISPPSPPTDGEASKESTPNGYGAVENNASPSHNSQITELELTTETNNSGEQANGKSYINTD